MPKRTKNIRLKIALDIPDICAYLISRLLRLKIKNENAFNEKLIIYNNIIEKALGNIKFDIIYHNFKNIGKEFNYDINKDF